jgi:hypothetical protein
VIGIAAGCAAGLAAIDVRHAAAGHVSLIYLADAACQVAALAALARAATAGREDTGRQFVRRHGGRPLGRLRAAMGCANMRSCRPRAGSYANSSARSRPAIRCSSQRRGRAAGPDPAARRAVDLPRAAARERGSYEAAAVRLHARMAIELPLRELDHAQLTLAALSGLRARDPLPAAQALAEFFDAAGLEALRQRIDAWLI